MANLDEAFWRSGAVINLDQESVLIGFGAVELKATKEELDSSRAAFYYPDFFLKNEKPWIQFASWQILRLDELDKELNVILEDSPEWSIGHQDLFQDAFAQLQEAFKIKKLEKAVPYTFAYSFSKMSKERLKTCLKKAISHIRSYPVFLYGYWNADEGVLGLTPETLFSYDQSCPSIVQTMALAGTKKRGSEQAFEGNDKENREHQLVVKGICQALRPFGNVQVEDKQLLSLPTLTHLLTPIQVSLKEPFHFEKLVQALHPTPALGAFPKQKGWEWLSKYQTKLDRKYFGAPVGFIYPENERAACYVSIRHVQWNRQGMRIGAGCGIVENSRCDQEWDEICLKVQAVRSSLAL